MTEKIVLHIDPGRRSMGDCLWDWWWKYIGWPIWRRRNGWSR